MTQRLHNSWGSHTLQLLGWREPVPHGHRIVPFDATSARLFLDQIAREDFSNMDALRIFLRGHGFHDLYRMTDHDVLREMAWLLEAGRARIAAAELVYRSIVLPPTRPKPIKLAPLAPSKVKYTGTIKSPAGPLKDWPFLLKRNGAIVDKSSLGGHTINTFRNDAWVSGRNGEFRFEGVEEGHYVVEALMPTGALVANSSPPPKGVGESGQRVTPSTLDTSEEGTDDPSWFRPTRVDDSGEFVWLGDESADDASDDSDDGENVADT